MFKLKKIGVMRMAFFMGLYGVFIGFIIGFLLSIFISMIPNQGASVGVNDFLLQLRWFNIIFLPLFFGVFNFLIALVLTPLINLILRIIKGLELDIVEEDEFVSKSIIPKKVKSLERTQSKLSKI